MAFVVSEGQLATVDRATTPPPFSVRVTDSLSQSYAAIFRSQPNVRTVVSFLARNIAQLGLHVFERMSDVDRRRLADHPLAALILRPNARTTRYRLIDALVSDLGIYDQAFWLKAKGDAGPAGVLRIPPEMVTPLGDSWLAPDQFRVRGTLGYKDIPADQIVHFRGYNPDDARGGLSPIETLRRILAEEYEAGTYREQLWRNQGRFSGYLKRPSGAPEWSPEARARFKAGWQSQYTGGGAGAGGTPVLEDGMEFVAAAVTPDQAQYIEARKLTREEVAAAYHIPLPMVGILDHATFSNITEQHKQLYQDTLGPWLVMIEEEIELQLLPDLDTARNVYVEFNLAEKLKGSFDEQAQQLQSAVGAPWLTRNEARARMNLAQIAGGDDLVVPLNVLIGGQASPTDSAPPKSVGGVQLKARVPQSHVDKAQQVLDAFFARQRAAVMTRLGAKAAPSVDEVFDVDRWTRELAGDLFALNNLLATSAARKAMRSLGLDPDDYDADRALRWLQANADGVSKGINGTTRGQLAEALAGDDPAGAVKHLYDVVLPARSKQIAATQATAVSGFGTTEAARQTGRKATKTWRVTSSRPRASHVALDGETVDLDGVFTNGARWPGDSTLSDDERAGCSCDLDITVEA